MYGIVAILADFSDWPLQVWLENTWWTYFWNLLIPASTIVIASKYLDMTIGPLLDEALRGPVYTCHENVTKLRPAFRVANTDWVCSGRAT